jgi:DNA uptake protein ComE-like DNA-binding protein
MPRQLFLILALGAGMALMAAGPARAYDKAQAAPAPRPAASAAKAAPKKSATRLVDLNAASRAELKTLPGIGDAEAEKIVAGRPYMTKTGLVEKKVLSLEAYDALRSRIVVVHKRPPSKPKV